MDRQELATLQHIGNTLLEKVEVDLNSIVKANPINLQWPYEKQFRTRSERNEICIALALHERLKRVEK